jgi:hypothetical protein
VHSRGTWCDKCSVIFRNAADLAQHHCAHEGDKPRPCPFPEKFDATVQSQVKKKRPQHTQEQIWYVLWDILFPGSTRPETPYVAESADMKTSLGGPPLRMEEPAIPTFNRDKPLPKTLFCSLCQEYPAGFHGQYELDDHIEKHHATARKVWICREAEPGSTFLAGCQGKPPTHLKA